VHFIVLLPGDRLEKAVIKVVVLASFKLKEQDILNHVDTSSINCEGDRVVKSCCARFTVLGEHCYEYSR